MTAIANIEQLYQEALTALNSANNKAEVEEVNVRYLGRKGPFSAILKSLKDIPEDQRRSVGAEANKRRAQFEQQVKDKLAGFSESRGPALDYTLPGEAQYIGRPHLLMSTLDQITGIFKRLGFSVESGPEIESDYYNFEALNFPPDHPARDMQDTFYLKSENGLPKGLLLRTHTSNVQIRAFERRKPPLKIVAPGRVFRHEAISTRSYCVFHQVEGFQVDTDISWGDLKGLLLDFCKEFFYEDVKLRFRPSFFPFTEPSAEVDVSCMLCDGRGCQLCKYDGWLEILGCGMIDPNVLKAVKYDPEKWSGYAFGMGVERVAMLKHGIPDIRMLYENNLRFLRQF